jgi:uncharacterized membrane protein (UPF0182 family)
LQLERGRAGVPHRRRNEYPQLKHIIVVSGDKIAMEPTFNGALNTLFGTQQP